MKNILIFSTVKTATHFQESIFNFIAKNSNYNFFEKSFLFNKGIDINKKEDLEKLPSPFIITSREEIFNLDFDLINIIILRHPINRLISEYYSFGWTHSSSCDWIENQKIKQKWEEEFATMRKKIKNQSLDEYVLENLENKKEYYLKAFENEGTIIPYEFMMNNPINFFELILNFINKKELINKMYNEFQNDFNYKEDLSEKITKNLLNEAHKRNLDNKEYIKKLNEKTIQIAKEKINIILEKYNILCKKYYIYCFDD